MAGVRPFVQGNFDAQHYKRQSGINPQRLGNDSKTLLSSQ